jgi:DNA-binding beta-propeller fold protein YncE
LKCGLVLSAAAAFVPAAALGAVVQFAAPAGSLPAGHLRDALYDAVLPSGRIVTPFGASVVTGMNALGLTLTPDGRYAIVSNDDERQGRVRSAVDSRILGGYSLAVVETATLRVADRFALPGETYFAGVAAVADPRFPARTLIFAAGGPSNAVYVLDLAADGHITPDVRHVIPIAGPFDPAFGDFGHSFPATLVAARDGRHCDPDRQRLEPPGRIFSIRSRAGKRPASGEQ